MQIPAGVLVAGAPARIKKEIGGEAERWVRHSAQHYVALAREYLAGSAGVAGEAENG